MRETVLQQARTLQRTIRQLQRRVLTRAATRVQHGPGADKSLTVAQLSTLLAIKEGGEMSLREIASAMGVSAPSASTMVDRLVEMGVLLRKPGATDRRAVRISVSAAGAAAVDAIETEMLESITDLLDKLGPSYARQWCEVYERIQSCLDEDDSVGRVQRRQSEGIVVK